MPNKHQVTVENFLANPSRRSSPRSSHLSFVEVAVASCAAGHSVTAVIPLALDLKPQLLANISCCLPSYSIYIYIYIHTVCMWCDVMWCDVMWCDVMSCHVMSCHVMSCHVYIYIFVFSLSNACIYMLHQIYNNSHTLCMCKQHNTCQQLESSYPQISSPQMCGADNVSAATRATFQRRFLSCPDMKPFAICPRGRDNPEFPAIRKPRKPSAWWPHHVHDGHIMSMMAKWCPWWPWQAWTSDFLASMIQDMISTGLSLFFRALGWTWNTQKYGQRPWRNANKNLFPTVKAFKMLHCYTFNSAEQEECFSPLLGAFVTWTFRTVFFCTYIYIYIYTILYEFIWYNMAWCGMDIYNITQHNTT